MIALSTVMSMTMKKTATTKTVAILWKKSLLLTECHSTCSMSVGRRAPNLRRAMQMVGLVAFDLALEDEVCDVARFLKESFTNSHGLLMIFSLIHGSVRS